MIGLEPAERRALIGEYVLGLLDDIQAAEIRDLIAQDPDAARIALEWEQHFLELSDQLPAASPSATLWPRIQHSLGLAPETKDGSRWPAWWSSLATWRLTSAALAMALIVALLPVLRPGGAPDRFTAVLQPPGEAAQPGWVVHVDREGGLRLESLTEDRIPADRSVQFWTLVDKKLGPRSLGLVQPGRDLSLSAEQIGAVQAGQLFELTLEPAGGSPYDRPSGQVLYIGRAVLASAH